MKWPPSAGSPWRRWPWPGCCATAAMTSALIGASRVEQIEQNVAALANLAFSAEELARIDAILKPVGLMQVR